MALTVTANLTTLNGANTSSNPDELSLAIGNKPNLDPDIVKEGANSINFTVTAQNLYAGLGFTSTDLTNEHIRMWFTSTIGSAMKTKANGGIRFFVRDSSGNESYWNVDGSDTYLGGWRNYCIYLNYTDNAPDGNNGTNANLAQLTGAGILMDNLNSIRNAINTWVDYLRYGDGLTVYGTPAFDIADIEAIDKANGYGIVEEYEGVYYLSGSIIIGDNTGANATIYDEENNVLVFTNKLVSSTLYKLEGVGNATGDTDITFTNCVITSAGPVFDLDFDSANIETIDILGCQISGADEILLVSLATVLNTVFNGCGQITPSTCEFHDNTIQNSTATNALVWPGTSNNIENCLFKGNTNAIVISQTSNQTFIGLLFGTGADANTADVNNTSGQAIEVAKTAGSNPTTSTGSGVTFTSSFTYKLTGLVNGTEVKAYTGSPGNSPTLIDSTDSVTNNEFTITHSSDGVAGYIVIHKFGWYPMYLYLTYPAQNAEIPISQIEDLVAWDPS